MNTNLDRYKTAWAHLESAISELESTQVGVNKDLYKKIERVIEDIGGCKLLIDLWLIESDETNARKPD